MTDRERELLVAVARLAAAIGIVVCGNGGRITTELLVELGRVESIIDDLRREKGGGC